MKRAYSPKEIMRKTYKTLPFEGRWREAFGLPEERALWFISGPSASGKSSFVMQLAYELTHHGHVLYMSYEEGLNRSFQERLIRYELDKRQGWFRVTMTDTLEELKERLRRRNSAKFIIVDSFQMAGWTYRDVEVLVQEFPRKCFIFISQEEKGQPMGNSARRLRYLADVKVKVKGFRAYCQGRFSPEAGNSFVVWEDGVIRTTNNVI